MGQGTERSMNETAAINVIARRIARDAVQAEIRARGRKLNDYTFHELVELTNLFFDLSRAELVAQAQEMLDRWRQSRKR